MLFRKPFPCSNKQQFNFNLQKVIYDNDQHLKSTLKIKCHRLKSTKLHNPENSNGI